LTCHRARKKSKQQKSKTNQDKQKQPKKKMQLVATAHLTSLLDKRFSEQKEG
jgi:hypothetical protein